MNFKKSIEAEYCNIINEILKVINNTLSVGGKVYEVEKAFD